jgi:redox-sensitive bicupin YhaK (pirin superfamily)
VSNLDRSPAELMCEPGQDAPAGPVVLPWRDVPLGGPRAMTVRRSLAHSEYSTPATTVLHGAQLWIALPGADRFAAPGFAHYEPPVTDVGGAKALVFLGSLFGQTSPVPAYSALVGAEVTLPAGHWLDVRLDAGHEHGFLCDTGSLAVGGAVAQPGEIVFQPAGASAITLAASPSEPTRVLVLGGEPFGEQIVMWWNFIGRSHEEVVAFREDWQRQRAAPGTGICSPVSRPPSSTT